MVAAVNDAAEQIDFKYIMSFLLLLLAAKMFPATLERCVKNAILDYTGAEMAK